jgi:hypothetical protein
VNLNSTNRSKLLAVLYAVTLVIAVLVWVILYGRGTVFHFAGVYTTPGIVVMTAMIVADGLIFLILSRARN